MINVNVMITQHILLLVLLLIGNIYVKDPQQFQFKLNPLMIRRTLTIFLMLILKFLQPIIEIRALATQTPGPNKNQKTGSLSTTPSNDSKDWLKEDLYQKCKSSLSITYSCWNWHFISKRDNLSQIFIV